MVFGSRFVSGRPHRVLYFWHSVGNRLLTLLSNMFTNLNLTDMETCYKAFRREVIQSIDARGGPLRRSSPRSPPRSPRGGWRDLRGRHLATPGRTYAEGKKIGWRDGFHALWAIVRYSVLRPAPTPATRTRGTYGTDTPKRANTE